MASPGLLPVLCFRRPLQCTRTENQDNHQRRDARQQLIVDWRASIIAGARETSIQCGVSAARTTAALLTWLCSLQVPPQESNISAEQLVPPQVPARASNGKRYPDPLQHGVDTTPDDPEPRLANFCLMLQP